MPCTLPSSHASSIRIAWLVGTTRVRWVPRDQASSGIPGALVHRATVPPTLWRPTSSARGSTRSCTGVWPCTASSRSISIMPCKLPAPRAAPVRVVDSVVSAARHSPTPSTALGGKATGFSIAANDAFPQHRSCTPLTAAQMWPADEVGQERVPDTAAMRDSCAEEGQSGNSESAQGAAALAAHSPPHAAMQAVARLELMPHLPSSSSRISFGGTSGTSSVSVKLLLLKPSALRRDGSA